MRYAFALILATVCTLSIVSAQTPAAQAPASPAGQEKPSTPPSQSAASAGKVTYTGCLKPGTGADTWTLENAEASAAGKAAGATATSGAKQTLSLSVKPSENIKPHANHKIEVTGTMSKAAAGAASSSSSANPTFTVESFKMVSATCP
jgi:hypothetical protein